MVVDSDGRTEGEGRHWSLERVCLLVVAVVAVACTLYWLRVVMVPFVLAVFVTLSLRPVVVWQARWFRLPRALAMATTFFGASTALVVIGGLVSTSVGELATRIEVYEAEVHSLIENVARALPLERFGVGVEEAVGSVTATFLGNASSVVVVLTTELVGVISSGFLVMVFMGFLLAGSTGLEAGRSGTFVGEVVWRVERYVLVKACVSVATGVLIGLNFHLFGVDLAMVFGVFAALLNFLPSVGSVVAVALPVPLVLISPDLGAWSQAGALLVPVLIQVLMGNVVEPLWMGRSLDLHPVTLLLALILWSVIWGVGGMFLAVPMTAVVKIVLERSEGTRALSEVLAGRFPQTGFFSFRNGEGS